MALSVSPVSELNKHASHSSKICNWAVPRQEINSWYKGTICGKGGPSVATLLGPAGPPAA